jgi:hypothetical protein
MPHFNNQLIFLVGILPVCLTAGFGRRAALSPLRNGDQPLLWGHSFINQKDAVMALFAAWWRQILLPAESERRRARAVHLGAGGRPYGPVARQIGYRHYSGSGWRRRGGPVRRVVFLHRVLWPAVQSIILRAYTGIFSVD